MGALVQTSFAVLQFERKGVLAMQNSFQFLVTYNVENKNQQQQKQQQQQELT
jgi:flagellar biosynthesis regulator FlbT